MKKIFLLLSAVLIINLGFAQIQPPLPSTQTQTQSKQTTIGQLQNNTGAVQMKGFAPPPPPPMGGSRIKPNPFLSTADFALLQNPTFEGGFRTGLSLGFSKSNLFNTSSFGANGLVTTDLTQRAISVFKSFNNKWVYSYSFAQIGTNQTSGVSITKLWNKNDRVIGLQLGYSNINGESFKISSPSLVAFWDKKFNVSSKLSISPNLYTTFSSPYWDRDKKSWSNDFSFNALVGTTFSYRFTKRFQLNLGYRGNINTNPKFGLMNNILIGSNFKF